jgi:hypothetical protein
MELLIVSPVILFCTLVLAVGFLKLTEHFDSED